MRKHRAPTQLGRANGGNRNIPVPPGRENKRDSQSSGERNGKSLNRPGSGPVGVAGRPKRVLGERNMLESVAIAGESPLREAEGLGAESQVGRDTRNPV